MKFEDVMVGMREGRITKASFQKYSDTLIEMKFADVEGSIFDGDRELCRFVNGEHMELTANFQKSDLEADWTVEHNIYTQAFSQVVLDVKLTAAHDVLMYRGSTVPDAIRAVRHRLPNLTSDNVRSICAYHEQGLQVLFPEEIKRAWKESNDDEI